MARKTPVQLVGGAYSDDALPWTAQDCVNYIPVFAEKEGTRSPRMLRGAPGWTTYCASMANAPIRGTYDCEGLLLAVAGNTLYRIASDGLATALGLIPGTERVTFAHNQVTGGNQVVIANGQSGYVYDTSDSSFTQITDDGFPGFRTVDFIDQFIIGVEPSGRYWLHSDLSDAKSYNTMDRSVAEKLPDKIQQVIASGSDVFVLGARSAQFFYNSGAATGTFANRPGTEMEIGAASPWTACRLDNTVYWLGHDGTVYRLEGNQPRRVSTHALEQAFSRADTSQAYAYTFEDRGHKIYYLTVGGRTWGFDVATGEWHRRKSFGLDFWRFSSLTRHRGRWVGGDYTNGRLYLLDWAVQTEAGAELERSRISPVLHDDQNKVVVNMLELVFDTGMDFSPRPPLSITGDLTGGFVGDSGTYQYTVSGGVPPMAGVTVLSGALPPGATMSLFGLVTYDYTTAGSYSWVVQVEDAEGNTATVADSAEVSEQVLPPQMTDWRYLQIGASDGTDYSSPSLDDSSWTIGAAPFGSWEAGYGPTQIAEGAPTALFVAAAYDPRFTATFATNWTNNTRLWLRRTLTLSAVPEAGVQITSYMDDNYQFYINGVLVVSSASGLPGGGGASFSIPSGSLVVGDNVIAIRCDDEAAGPGISVVYADFLIEVA